MKRSLLFGLLIVCALQSAAQKIRFTDTSNKWTYLFFTDDPYASVERSWYGSDTLIAGVSYRRLHTSLRGVAGSTLAIREDTALGKLFFRYILSNSDTGERQFFDYGLKAGDTLKIVNGTNTYKYVVLKRDSVIIGGAQYKHWSLASSFPKLDFIEGIGTNHYPLQLVYPFYGLRGAQLRCFTNMGGNPLCKPAIPLPFASYTPHFPSEPYGATAFDNDTSCSILRLAPGEVGLTAAGQAAAVFPNPGGVEMALRLPSSLSAMRLQIRDFSGRVMLEMMINGSSFPVGQYLRIPGVYTCTLQDATTGRRYVGRFVYQ